MKNRIRYDFVYGFVKNLYKDSTFAICIWLIKYTIFVDIYYKSNQVNVNMNCLLKKTKDSLHGLEG